MDDLWHDAWTNTADGREGDDLSLEATTTLLALELKPAGERAARIRRELLAWAHPDVEHDWTWDPRLEDGDEWVPDDWDGLSPDALLDQPPSYDVERVEQLTEPIELAFVGESNRGFLPARAKPDYVYVGRLEEGLQLTEALEPIDVSDTPMLGNLTEAYRDVIAYLTDPDALPEAVDVDIDG